MSLWHPNDLVSDADLVAYESAILTQFGEADWQARRQKALDDWLMPLLEGRGFPVDRFRTRATPDKVWSLASAVYTDRTAAAQTSDGLNLASLLATSAHYLLVGAAVPFRGLSLRMLDNVSSVTATVSVDVWADTWAAATVTNETAVGAAAFARGGSMTWGPIDGVVRRVVNGSDALYWARLSASAAPTGALAGPLAVVRRSRLNAAATFRTLMHIFREAPVSQEGPWVAKADWYEQEAEKAWLRVADQIGAEFDTDDDDQIDGDENTQTADAVSGGWTLERS